jgi:4-hydroxybenzoyl-CoA reductase subunit alpha
MEKRIIQLTVNGEDCDLIVTPNRTLLEVLRNELNLTGTKEGCGEGACGMCTALLDGQPVRSCLTLAVEAQGKAITTIEGLVEGGRLHPIQRAFVEHGAIQCGFCSPGMILVTKALLDENPHPTEQEAREAISGNVCRCTGYAKIVEAIERSSESANQRSAASADSPIRSFALIGTRMPRIDAPAKATGEAKFTADLMLPRMLHAKVLRSPYPHARIVSIDTGKAEQLPGVKAVVTGRDTGGVKWGVFSYTRDQELLPTEKVRYVDDEVAAVAATSEEIAEEALTLIKVEYEVLPAVCTIEEAMADGAPLLHEGFERNINIHVPIVVGDVEQGFRDSFLVREDTFVSEEESHFMSEPLAVVANYTSEGVLEMWMPNAAPHMKAKALSNLLEMPLHKVHVRKSATGGAFGGRSDIFPGEFICALLSIRTQRPVKLVYTREENTLATRQGHNMIARIKTGVDRRGLVLARDMTLHMDGGAYSSTGPIATTVPFLCLEQVYRMPNVRFDGYRIYTNKPARGMIRTHGRAFAGGIDMQLDMIAEELGIDAGEIRLRNATRVGDVTPTGSKVFSCALDETINKAMEVSGWKEKRGKLTPSPVERGRAGVGVKWRGIGMGCNSVQTGFTMGIRGGSQAFIKFDEDGGVTVISGVVDNGQGNDNMLVQIAAEELGVPPEDIRLISADTEVTPLSPGSFSMVSTFAGGNAVRLAAIDARHQLFEIASYDLEVPADELEARDRRIFVRGDPEQGIPIAKVVRKALILDKPIMGRGHYSPKVDHSREWVKNPRGQLSEAFSFGTTIAAVEVDPETGQVKVLEVTAAQDVGFALNPMAVEGQFESGVAMGGQGGVLTEGHQWAEGHLLNPTYREYKIPLACDMPKINTVIVESIDPSGPYGAKEAGMSIAMSAAQAYANAICNAIGTWIHQFPMTPEVIREAIERKGKA